MDPETIDFSDQETVKIILLKLLNIIESQAQLIEGQQKQIQSLKDEINRLKGRKKSQNFVMINMKMICQQKFNTNNSQCC